MRDINNISNTMICKIRGIRNANTLDSINRLDDIVTVICFHNRLNIVNKLNTIHHDESKENCLISYSLMYVLEYCHITIKTFPSSNSILFHLTFHKNFDHSDCCLIYNFLVEALSAELSLSTVEFDNITNF